ncbi:MAG: hypothetical protein IKV90_00820 [Clostridia bacterium]|nr:hypothetical protein [Clostridia bacterium]
MKNQKMKSMLMLVFAALLLTVAVGSTLAYLLDTTKTVENTFTPVKVTCEVDEPGWSNGGSTKSDVSIKNTGTTDAYIRVAVVGNWYNADGNIIAPHTVDLGTPNGWTKGSDGYYYHTAPVAPGENTSKLISSYTPIRPEGVPTDAHFEMNIISQAIQADGMGATGAENAFAIAAK